MDLEHDSSSNTSTETAPRVTRNVSSRLAKKSVTQADFHYAGTSRQLALQREKEKNKFLESFNPETSAREMRKLDKKYAAPAGAINDYAGVHIDSGIDLCDCFEEKCEGCFFPCKKCDSEKCGPECRRFRKTIYKSIEYHGFNFSKKFPLDDKDK